MEIGEGVLVRHPKKPEWGLGKVLARKGNSATIFFKNDPVDCRTIQLDIVSLQIADEHSDEMLDRLPPFVDGALVIKERKVTIPDGIARFKEIFPLGFNDPTYLEASKGQDGGERGYKVRAHQRWMQNLGDGKGEELLAQGKFGDLREAVQSIVTKDHMNLLSQYEAMAFRDGLAANDDAARSFFAALFNFVSGGPEQSSFKNLAKAVEELPVEEGRARVATWPVQTLLPFLADPKRFMFLKPEPTQACANRLRFDLLYDSALRWATYERLMEMGTILLKRLRPLGAQDFIDVQSFVWVIQKY